jgi:hypothetical protein
MVALALERTFNPNIIFNIYKVFFFFSFFEEWFKGFVDEMRD